jgi:ligand-binding sensor domain-containing protein
MHKPYGKRWTFSFRLITLLVVSPLLLWGQVERLSFHHLTPDGGLSQASNDFVYKDSKGFVWLSSLDGLNRFDGKEVKVYKSISGDSTSLLGNIITSSFFEDQQTNLWFTTYEGIHCYIREKDHFQHVQLKNGVGDLLTEDYRAIYLDPENQLWLRIGTGEKGRLHVFDIDAHTGRIHCAIDGQRNVPVTDKNGRLTKVVSTVFPVKNGVEVIDIQKKGALASFFRGEKKDFPSLYSHHARPDNPNTWYLGMQGGLALFDPEKKEVDFISTYQEQPIGDVFSTENINDSICWVATASQGVLVFHKNRRQFISQVPYEPDKQVGLHLNPVNQLFRDSSDNIWLTSFTSGVNFAQLNKRKFDLPDHFIGSSISAIFETSQGAVFCSYGRGKTAYFPKAISPPQDVPMIVPEGVRMERIQFFVEDPSGDFWAATSNYLVQWNPDLRQFEYKKHLPTTVLYLYQNRDGQILLSTYSGIYSWTSEPFGVQIEPCQILGEFQSELATAIHEDKKGRLYLALDASRLLILEKKGQTYQPVRNIEGIGYAKAFFEEENTLWVATSTGILQLDIESMSSRLLNEIEDGAPNEFYYSVLRDSSGLFWLSCNRGIIRYDYENKSARRFTLSDGLQGNEYNSDAFLKTQNEEIWMGGVNGLNRFFPASDKESNACSSSTVDPTCK